LQVQRAAKAAPTNLRDKSGDAPPLRASLILNGIGYFLLNNRSFDRLRISDIPAIIRYASRNKTNAGYLLRTEKMDSSVEQPNISGDLQAGAAGLQGQGIENQKKYKLSVQAGFQGAVNSINTQYFDMVVNSLCQWLNVDCAIIGQIIEGGKVKVLSMKNGNEFIHDYTYSLKGTPCETVVNKGICVYPENISRLFPNDSDLVRLGAEGYIGTLLKDGNDEPSGILCAISRTKLSVSRKEEEIISNIADKVTAEIGKIKAEEDLIKSNYALKEKINEIQCLYNLSKIVSTEGVKLDEMFQDIVEIIPHGWRHPENICARILFDNKEYKTKNFMETRWKRSAEIAVRGVKSGTIDVYCLLEKPRVDENPFHKEKENLINAIAERAGKTAERLFTEEELLRIKEFIGNILESMNEALIVVDSGGMIEIANNAALKLTGYSIGRLIKRPMDLILKESAPSNESIIGRIIKNGSIKIPEMICKSKIGREIPVRFSGSILLNCKNKTNPAVCPHYLEKKCHCLNKVDKIVCNIEDISEPTRLYNQLQHKSRELNNFVSVVSHDLKSPLHVIRGYSKQLLDDCGGSIEENSLGNIKRIINNTDTMSLLSG